MLNWKADLKQFFANEAESPIAGYDDEKRIVEVRANVDLDTARSIEEMLERWNVDYEVKQLL